MSILKNRLDINTINNVNEKVVDRIVQIDIHKLIENENNFYSVENIEQLAEDIKTNGLFQPVMVNSEYKIISGHRRTQACKLAGIDTIPCIIKTFDSKLLEEIALITTNNYRSKSPDERNEEIKKLKIYYTELKSTDPNYKDLNINKIVSDQLNVSVSTVKRANQEKIESVDTLTKYEEDFIKNLSMELNCKIKMNKKSKNLTFKFEEIEDLEEFINQRFGRLDLDID